MKLVVASVLVCLLAKSATAAPRIVGGSDVPEGKYPFVVSLKYSGRHTCTASILNNRYILTAAHCIVGRAEPEKFTVKVGSTEQANATTGVVYEVDKLIVHEKYVGYYDDVALVRLKENLKYNNKVQPIKLTNKDVSKAGYPVIAMGWGETKLGSGAPNKLQELTVKLVSQKECTDGPTVLKDSFICTLLKVGHGVCRGDSGGPLVADGVQIGIASMADLCARGSPDIFVRVYKYIDWINDKVAEY